jgi:hypothetical protein
MLWKNLSSSLTELNRSCSCLLAEAFLMALAKKCSLSRAESIADNQCCDSALGNDGVSSPFRSTVSTETAVSHYIELSRKEQITYGGEDFSRPSLAIPRPFP